MRSAGMMVLVAAVAVTGACTEKTPEPVRPEASATVAVERTDLTTARTREGTLGFGTPRTIKAPGGTVTWLPAAGAAMTRGRALYRNDDHPVVVFYGATPLFRAIGTVGMSGRDVRVVVSNLRALGYRCGDQPRKQARPGDAVVTGRVVEAVKEWQRDAGLPVTGVVEPKDVVVLPGAVRVSRITAQLGDPADGGVLAVTGSGKAVTVPVPAAEAESIRPGAAVKVELPGGQTTAGTVRQVDRDAQQPDGGDQAEVDVTVTLKNPRTAKGLDSAPVQVTFAGETRKDVLAVPVSALLALKEGGYALQIPGGALVPVETGMFAMGLVEVRGEGLTEGARVVTAS